MSKEPARKTGHAVARVAFLANREMVKKALDEGWSAKAIYEKNPSKFVAISYRQFVRYVNDMRPVFGAAAPSSLARSSPRQEPVGQPSLPSATQETTSNARHEPAIPTAAGRRGFPTFRHNPSLSEEDRIKIYGPDKPSDE